MEFRNGGPRKTPLRGKARTLLSQSTRHRYQIETECLGIYGVNVANTQICENRVTTAEGREVVDTPRSKEVSP